MHDSRAAARRRRLDLIAFACFGFLVGLLLVWIVRFEVQLQLADFVSLIGQTR